MLMSCVLYSKQTISFWLLDLGYYSYSLLFAVTSTVIVLSFTGGDTGISISKKAGMIPLQMELGGKDACIVLEDADLDLVAANIIKGGFSYRFEEMNMLVKQSSKLMPEKWA